ncbi:hypothetical protein GW915_05430 [bacterium]|nr:hypothetical protein [bacterium]
MKNKLKDSKHRIELLDGRPLHFHVPAKPEVALDLFEFIPRDFSNIEVEIGCGKGEFIARRAAALPNCFFIGIDRRKDRHDLTVKKLARAQADNCRILKEDARSFLSNKLPNISILHVYHPDPWPKSRQHKHRFFRSPDAKTWAEAIVSGGELRISTDHREYFEEILDIIQSWQLFKPHLQWTKTAGTPLTHFESIFLKKKEPVFKAHFIKK